MRAILDYCTGRTKRHISAGTLVIREGGKTGHLFVLIDGRLEVFRSDSVVAVLTEPGAVLGEMSVLLDQPHSATVRAASDSVIYEVEHAALFLRDQPEIVLLMVLSELAPASITCALGRAATSRHAASRMGSTVMVWRRNWSLRQSAETYWLWWERGRRK